MTFHKNISAELNFAQFNLVEHFAMQLLSQRTAACWVGVLHGIDLLHGLGWMQA